MFPSPHAERGLGRSLTLAFGFSQRITRPEGSTLDAYRDPEFYPSLHSGNPAIRPQYTNALEANVEYSEGALARSLTAYHRQSRDAMTDSVQDRGHGLSLVAPANLPREQRSGLEVSATGPLLAYVTCTLSGDVYALRSAPTPSSDLTFRSGLRANDKLRVAARPSAPWSIVLTGTDLLKGQRIQRRVATADFVSVYDRSWRGRIVCLGCVNAFGAATRDAPKAMDYQD